MIEACNKIQMADAEYYALERLSFSSGKHLLKSPRKYIHERRFPFKGNDATELGSAIHLWLEGERSKIIFEPDLSQIKTKEGNIAKNPRMTSEGKAILKQCEAGLAPGHMLMPFEYKDLFWAVEEQFDTHPKIQDLVMKATDIEGAYLFEIDGIKFKGKLDFEGKDFIIDIKSVGKAADYWAFKRTIAESHYDLQAALYLTAKAKHLGVSIWDIEYHFIAVETTAPFDIHPYTLSEKTITDGLDKMKIMCHRYKTHILDKKKYHKEFEII